MTLREIVEKSKNSDRYNPECEDFIRFELNHLELHGLDDYLVECHNRGLFDERNETNSHIKYLLGMTDVIDTSRPVDTVGGNWPDIDVDFQHDSRERVKDYLREKYGHECVASIGTISFSKAKGIFKDCARIFGIPFARSNEISKLFPDLAESIDDALEGSAELRQAVESDETIARVMEYAKRLEGTVRATGVHAAGIVISPEPVTDLVPLFESKGEAVTMFDGPTLEKIGLIKYDILGLKALTVISKTIELIKERHGVEIDIDNIPEDDEKAFRLIDDGNSFGIFQIEGSKSLRDFAAACKPRSISDIAAIISLYRPGPIGLGALDEYVKRRNDPTADSHFEIPEFDYIFKDTNGLLIYQEQLMALARDMCGFDDIETDVLRKATAKKIRELLLSLKEKFVEGAYKHSGQDKKKISDLFDRMEEFSRYSFNKSHAIAYAYISYQTAWLKANYTAEYMAASISCEPDPEQQAVYMEDARRNNVQVLPPDINISKKDFVVDSNGNILFGFNSIKGMGQRAIDKIIALAPFDSFGDFLIRSYHAKGINKKIIEALILSGACDTFGYKRSNLIVGFERFLMDYSQEAKQEEDPEIIRKYLSMQDEYFDTDTPEFPALKILEYEKQYLGLYISGNPFDIVGSIVKDDYFTLKKLQDIDRGNFLVLCQINKVKRITTKKGDPMAFLDVIDEEGHSDSLVIFPNVYNKVSDKLDNDKYILAMVFVKTDSRGKSLQVSSIVDLTSEIDNVSDKIEADKGVKHISVIFRDIGIVRFKSILRNLQQLIVDEKTGYTIDLIYDFENMEIKLSSFNCKAINISTIRALSKINGIVIRRG